MADGWATDDAKLWWEQHLPEFTGPLTLTGATADVAAPNALAIH